MQKNLLLLSPIAVPEPAAAALTLPRKFLDGVRAFAELWDGSLTLLLPQSAQRDDNLDYVAAARTSLGFEVQSFPDGAPELRTFIRSASIVLVPLVPQFTHVHALCRECNTPVVYNADMTLAIRQEIVRAQTRNPILQWRRLLWNRRLEKKYRVMLAEAAGLQLQGVPACKAYAAFNPVSLCYLNTRVPGALLATGEQLNARANRLRQGAPLVLIYSGRLVPIKGVEDLPRVAVALREMGVSFELNIFGGGILEQKLGGAIQAAHLENVHLRGEQPFAELMRFAAKDCDLFICCHRQGDPSATFGEMLGAGVPLIGYDTSGLRGMVQLSKAGWLTSPNDVYALASQIARLDRNRQALIGAACTAAEFSRDKCFEDVMQQRVAHLHDVLRAFHSAGAHAA